MNIRELQDSPRARRSHLWWIALLIAGAGVLVRVLPQPGFSGVGFDENLYRTYVLALDARGLGGYSSITDAYLTNQRREETMAKLPPTRFLYIFTSWAWKQAEFGAAPPLDLEVPANIARDPALVSLHRVSCLFSVLSMLLAGLIAWRLLGAGSGLGVLALMACAPLQIHMAQHALIDGFFAFWALLAVWSLWENLQRPNHPGWLALLGASLALMVMTKENSFFVAAALAGLLMLNRWLRFGAITPRLLMVMALGPVFGVAVLIALAGGVVPFLEIYRLLVTKAQQLTYAIQTGDGPWHRYLIDLLTVSPAMLLLAIGGMFCVLRERRAYGWLLGFVLLSYAVMCQVRYGMNLRYAIIWDLPLRAFAYGQIAWLTRQCFSARQPIVVAAVVAALCAYELRQYFIFFGEAGLYELATGGLLEAVKVLK